MKIEDLTKTQLIMLAFLISFVSSIFVGITVVNLMSQEPQAVTQTINRVVQHTVEKVVQGSAENNEALSKDQEKLLADLKNIQPLTVSLYVKGEKEDKLLGTGLFYGETKVIVASIVPEPKKDEVYVVKSVLGERKISKITVEKDYTIIELAPIEVEPIPDEVPDETTPPADPTTPPATGGQ